MSTESPTQHRDDARGCLTALLVYAPLILSGFLTTAGFVVPLFLDAGESTQLPNAVLAVVTGLAVLAFTYAQAVADDRPNHALLVTAGEIFVACALMILLAMIFKHALADPAWVKLPKADQSGLVPLRTYMSGVTPFFAYGAAIVAHIGAGYLITALLRRWGWIRGA